MPTATAVRQESRNQIVVANVRTLSREKKKSKRSRAREAGKERREADTLILDPAVARNVKDHRASRGLFSDR